MNGEPVPVIARRYLVVFGDSLAEGRDDPHPAGGWLGWAGRLADHLEVPGERVANVARPGATAVDVAQDQLPRVRHLRPSLVLVNCGMNDVLNGFERSVVGDRLEEVFGWARVRGAVAIAAPVPHPPLLERSPMSDFRKRRMLQRIHDVNHDLSRTAHEYGMTFLDQDAVPGVSDPSLWSADGIHLNSAGHAYVAEVMAHITRSLLGERAV